MFKKASMVVLCVFSSLTASCLFADDLDHLLPGNENDQIVIDAFEGFNYSYDPFESAVDFYSVPNGESSLGLVGNIKENTQPSLILMVNYVGSEWIYADRVQILVDGEVWSRENFVSRRNVFSGNTRLESALIPFDADVEALLDKMHEATDPVMVRISGQKTEDYSVSKETIDSFYELKEALKLL